MSENKIHELDIGVPLVLTIIDRDTDAVVDISAATVLQIWLWKPSGEVDQFTATLYTDGTDGKMVYIFAENDLDEDGVCKYQPYIETPTQRLHGDVVNLRVYTNLKDHYHDSFSAYLVGS